MLASGPSASNTPPGGSTDVPFGRGVVLRNTGGVGDVEGSNRLTRNIRVLSLVSFLQDTASEMLYPVLPLFVTSVLGAPPAVLGLIEGVAEATASISKIFSGRMADLRRRRPLVATGYAISSISKPLIGLAGAWPLVLVGRFTDRLGKGVRGTAPRRADR